MLLTSRCSKHIIFHLLKEIVQILLWRPSITMRRGV